MERTENIILEERVPIFSAEQIQRNQIKKKSKQKGKLIIVY